MLDRAGIDLDEKLAPIVGSHVMAIANWLMATGARIAGRDPTTHLRDSVNDIRDAVALGAKLTQEEREQAKKMAYSVVLVAAYGGFNSRRGDDEDGTVEEPLAPRTELSMWIEYIRPLFKIRRSQRGDALDVEYVIRSLLALDAGETTELFAAKPPIARSKFPYRLREIQLKILLTIDELKKRGWTTAKINDAIRLEYDTVKRWRGPVSSLPPEAAQKPREDHQGFLNLNPDDTALSDRLARLCDEFNAVKQASAEHGRR